MEKRNIIIKRIILAVVIISVLVAAFFIDGNAVPQKAETDTAEEAYSAVPDRPGMCSYSFRAGCLKHYRIYRRLEKLIMLSIYFGKPDRKRNY